MSNYPLRMLVIWAISQVSLVSLPILRKRFIILIHKPKNSSSKLFRSSNKKNLLRNMFDKISHDVIVLTDSLYNHFFAFTINDKGTNINFTYLSYTLLVEIIAQVNEIHGFLCGSSMWFIVILTNVL